MHKVKLRNSYSISLIEGKLPRRIMTKWLDQEESFRKAEDSDDSGENLEDVSRLRFARLVV